MGTSKTVTKTKMTDQKKNDHDLLITLGVKVDQLRDDIKDMNDGFRSRVRALEEKVEEIDKLHAKVDPIIAVKHLNTLDERLTEYENKGKGMWIVLIIIGSFLGVFFSVILPIILHAMGVRS